MPPVPHQPRSRSSGRRSGLLGTLVAHWPLPVVLALTAALLLSALAFGLPRTDLGQDERITHGRVLGRYPQGDNAVPRYNWPELQVSLGRWVSGAVRAVEDRLGREPLHPYLLGRGTVVLFGLLMVSAVYGAGVRLLGPRAGALAAALLPAMPLFAFRSRLWVPDAPMTAFYALALLLSVLIVRRPSWVRFAAAGVCVGLATGTKYNGAGAAFPVVVAALLAAGRLPRQRRWPAVAGRLLLAGACSVVVFTLVNPALLTDTRAFFHGVFWVGEVYTSEPPSGLLGYHVLRYIALSFCLGRPEGIGPLICVLALAGAILLALRERAAATLVLLPAALYAVAFASLLHNSYERLFMPLLPHVALAAGYGLAMALERLETTLGGGRGVRVATAALAVLVPAIAWVPVIAEARAARGTDTRIHALRWMEDHLPRGASVFREWNMVRPSSARFTSNGLDRTLYAGGRTAPQIAAAHDFVVVTSTMYDWVLRQRDRPGFEVRAALYEQVFEGPRFELVRSFAPGTRSIGPEVRIYRTLPPRGPKYRPNRAVLELLGKAWGSRPRLREQAAGGEVRFAEPWETLAGKVVLVKRGLYRLEVEASAARPTGLLLRLGDGSRERAIEGDTLTGISVVLPAGQVWWSVQPADEPDRSGLTVRGLRLVRERRAEAPP